MPASPKELEKLQHIHHWFKVKAEDTKNGKRGERLKWLAAVTAVGALLTFFGISHLED